MFGWLCNQHILSNIGNIRNPKDGVRRDWRDTTKELKYLPYSLAVLWVTSSACLKAENLDQVLAWQMAMK